MPDGELRFRDVTAASGLANTETGMGVAAGDVDDDGDVDLYFSNLGPDGLWLNNGDGTFRDHSDTLDDAVDGWSTSAVFVDADGDDNLDILVARYVQMDRLNARRFFGEPFTLTVRDDLSAEELQSLLRGSGVVYVREDLLELMEARLAVARALPVIREHRARMRSGRADVQQLRGALARIRDGIDRPAAASRYDRFLELAGVDLTP